jgi:hypothetical protein
VTSKEMAAKAAAISGEARHGGGQRNGGGERRNMAWHENNENISKSVAGSLYQQ